MTPEAVATTLRRVRLTPRIDRLRHTTVGVGTIAKEAGVSRATVYRAVRGEDISWQSRIAIRDAVTRMDQRGQFEGLPPLASSAGHRCPTCGRLR